MMIVDRILNQITMYRLVLYYLIGLLGAAVLFAFAGLLPYDPFALLFTIGFLIAVCVITNTIFARTYGVPANAESAYISALILALIITPIQSNHDLWFLGWAAVWAMASKYLLAIRQKHIFNPVAFAVALTYFTINQSASWWVGDAHMLPLVLLGGLLILRKIGRLALLASFLGMALAITILTSAIGGANLGVALQQAIVYSPLLFFAFVILTEPLTLPAARRWQIAYGAIVGAFFAPQFHIGAFYATPEVAILVGNLFAFIASPQATLVLRLKQRLQLAPGLYDFVFEPAHPLAFVPGQYMEWTLGHRDPDNRGNRRFFTLASSPTEPELRLGIKFYEHSSTFKQALLALQPDQAIVATHVAGDFVLPANPRRRCVLIAGGIGVTPFRSMVKYLLDTGQQRPITLLYAGRSTGELIYRDVFDQAQRQLGLKIVYALTDPRAVPAGWQGQVGYVTPQLIQSEVPDYRDCLFFISGPPSMVAATQDVLADLQIPRSRIKTDLFAGLA